MTLFLSGVEIRLELHAVHVKNDDHLRQLLKENPDAATDKLVQEIVIAYEQAYGQPLSITPDSLAVEIWGHLYMDQFAKYIDRMVQLQLIKKIAAPIQQYCAVIDCGEKEHDGNRWFWDLLAPFKSTIAGWLPDHEKKQD
ncbi:MAG TPA: hypothetical protein VF421_10870 [Niabella sp.]